MKHYLKKNLIMWILLARNKFQKAGKHNKRVCYVSMEDIQLKPLRVREGDIEKGFWRMKDNVKWTIRKEMS